MHERAKKRARTIEELRSRVGDRRGRIRRGDPGDELGAQLTAAFSRDRRRSGERRG
jgi:hypothetical protein